MSFLIAFKTSDQKIPYHIHISASGFLHRFAESSVTISGRLRQDHSKPKALSLGKFQSSWLRSKGIHHQ